MRIWEEFLNSLATRGGNIVILLFCAGALFFAVFHSLHHPEVNAEIKTVILSTFSGFTGALLQALVGGSSRQRAVDGNGPSQPVQPKA